jgi:hypothetical protein
MKNIDTNDFIYVPAKTLITIMNELKHTHIDLLKIDIEGVECDIIEDMIKNNIFPTYLSVDFDTARCIHNGKIIVSKVINKLLKVGEKF